MEFFLLIIPIRIRLIHAPISPYARQFSCDYPYVTLSLHILHLLIEQSAHVKLQTFFFYL